LLQFLIGLKKKYSKTNSSLVIFFDGHRGINLEAICRSIEIDDFPFQSILFIEVNKNKEDVWILRMGQIWPTYGYNEYDPIKAIKQCILEKYTEK